MSWLEILTRSPWLAFLVAAAFGALYATRPLPSAFLAGTAWLIYGVYEYAMKFRILCSGECNIRVDLLLIYPALLAVSGIALVNRVRATLRTPTGRQR